MSAVRTATAYLQIEGVAPGNGYHPRDKAAVRAVTNVKPRTVKNGCIVVKLEIRIPAAAWEPFAPTAVIDVPADLTQHVITVEAGDANDG